MGNDNPTPTTPLAEARRIRDRWYEEQPSLEGDNLLEEANNTIDALVTLVVAAESAAVKRASGPAQRDFQFDGMDHCPSFAIVVEGSDVSVVVNPALWRFDEDELMSEQMFNEVMSPLGVFLHDKLDEQTVHNIAASLRGSLEKLVREGRITKRFA